jgi:hypothetical protein
MCAVEDGEYVSEYSDGDGVSVYVSGIDVGDGSYLCRRSVCGRIKNAYSLLRRCTWMIHVIEEAEIKCGMIFAANECNSIIVYSG